MKFRKLFSSKSKSSSNEGPNEGSNEGSQAELFAKAPLGPNVLHEGKGTIAAEQARHLPYV